MEQVLDSPLSYVLLADGTSDRALLPVILWTLRRLWKDGSFASPTFIPRNHSPIEEKLDEIVRDYKPDLVFIHRDAENRSREERLNEIPKRNATVPIVPVKMTEAWLLIDESALRTAAGNPNGRSALEMPSLNRLETLSYPKQTLHDLLRTASGNKGRRLHKFNVPEAVHRISERITDYSALLELHAFRCFYECLTVALIPFKTRGIEKGSEKRNL